MKGKYAARAALREDAAEIQKAEDAYKRQIVRLTQERDEARRERDEARRDWRVEVRSLQAMNREGTSHRVEALSFELERIREKNQKLQLLLANRQRDWEKFLGKARTMIMDVRSCPSIEAVEILASWGISPGHAVRRLDDELAIDESAVEDEGQPVVLANKVWTDGVHASVGGAAARLGVEQVKAIQRARGVR